MPDGYCGRVLHIDLTQLSYFVEEPDETFYRTYLGGGCMGAYYLIKETRKNIDPLSGENVLVFAASVCAGADAPGLSKHTVMAKSPLTGGIGESQSEGFWAAELKKAGFDCIVIKGKSRKPVYIYIEGAKYIEEAKCIEGAKIRFIDASYLWGLDTADAIDAIKAETSNEGIRAAVIGKAGEKLVRYASIVNDYCYGSLRTGMGAVMGSKNLKAIAVSGFGQIKVKYPGGVEAIARDYKENADKCAEGKLQKEYGTAYDAQGLHDAGMAVNKNFTSDSYPKYKEVCRLPFENGFIGGSQGCYGCAGDCKKMLKPDVKLPFDYDCRYGLYEYDAFAALCGACGMSRFENVLKAYELCCKYSLDPVSTGGTIAFAVECFENGIITAEDTDGEELTFGNDNAVVNLIVSIAERTGIGDILAEGSMRAAQHFGNDAVKYAMQVKGKELPMHEPRIKVMLALGYAVSPNGPDYCVVEHDTDFDFLAPEAFMEGAAPLGIYNRLEDVYLGPEKIAMFYKLQCYWSFMEVIGACIFMTAPVRYLPINSLVTLISSITGWEISLWELMKAGEKRVNMMRMYNIREGFSKKDDWLPERIFESINDGPRKGQQLSADDMRKAIDLYYEMMNWDNNGIPRYSKMVELEIDWIYKYM